MATEKHGRLHGKVVLVTGGNRGIGLACAELCAAEGASVALCARNRDEGMRAASDLSTAGAIVHYLPLEVKSKAAWETCIAAIIADFKRIDVLVNNAAVIVRKKTMEVSEDEWTNVINTNLTGPLLGIQAVADHMRDGGGGSIINIGSIAGFLAHFDCAYSASKWGLRGLTRCAALDLAPWGIRVNSVDPSMVDTPMTETQRPGHAAASIAATPLGRVGRPEEVAQCVLFFASDDSSYVTGTELVVDGGLVAAGLPNLRSRVQRAIADGTITTI